VELRRAHEVRRGAERALEQTDATMNALKRKTSQIEEENKAMVQQIVGLTKELQEARDSEEEARLLRRQRVQMFREVSACVMEAARRLGIEGLSLPPAPEDDGAILRFFCQLSNKLVEDAARATKLIDAECRELLGMAGMHIFSNL
jgi:septal ring factor EnvC (AmiA/AmiB activator)